ncbi:MAG: hypothetical protein ILNGONEN_00812 [Syntrophorhabdaceae bacterium]|jgi:hypothetical protein|nr:hypothetical protein [Syntrophorhabdaceae bacterium]
MEKKKLGPRMSEEQIAKAIELRTSGQSCRQIAASLGVAYQSVTRELRLRGIKPESLIEEEVFNEADLRTRAEAQALRIATEPNPLPPAPTTTEQLEQRTEDLSKKILQGAERLINSINQMPDEALAAANLNHKATALGILVDKLKVLTNKANPMFGATGSATQINIVNVIATATRARKKDLPPEDITDVNPI